MPIQNEQNAEIIKSIWNYNKFEIGGIQLRHGLVQGARQINSIKGEASKHLSKYYIVFNLLNIKRELKEQQHVEQQRELAIQQLKRLRTHVMYLSYILTKLCLIIVLLLPFLTMHKTLIQQSNAQNILDPIPLSIANSNSAVNSFKFIRNKTHQPHQIPKTIRRNPLNFYKYYSNHSKENGYSLIILSQSKHFYSEVVHEANNKFLSTNSVQNLNSFTSASTNRTKRYINVKDSTASIHKIINKKEASSQILKSTSGEHKNNHNIYKNSKNSQDKLTKLVMNGLGLKKLPDMKKANISQIEYSRKYIEYLERLRKRKIRKNNDDDMENTATHLQIYSIVTSKFKDITRKRRDSSERAIRSTKHFKNSQRRVGNRNKLDENDKTNILLHFPLMVNDAQFNYEQINEANVRLMILYNPSLAIHARSVETDSKAFRRKTNNRYYKKHAQNGTDCKNDHINNYSKSKTFIQKPNNSKRKKHILNLKVYQLLRLNKRQILDGRQIEFDNDLNYSATRGDETYSQWLEFDVTVAVRSWLNKSRENLGIEIQCDKCKRIGARILSEVSTLSPHLIESTSHHIQDQFHLTPVLNIIGHIGRTHSEEAIHPQTLNLKWNNQSHNDYFYHRYGHGQGSIKKLPNSCYRAHQRCCRHQLDVDFKNIKGFEFIIQPKTFDAGYCKGRCPPRHNPAHHHALLQSLIWQQDHNRVPRPCCVPSQLTEIEILHVDEEHSDKLKISTWSNMQVIECACS